VRPVRTDAAPRRPESRAGDRRPEQPETQEGDMGKGPATVRARYRKTRRYAAVAAATVMGAALAVGATMTGANATSHTGAGAADSMAGSWSLGPGTATPIKHLVVIFQENISFDHYFGTYPHAANTGGQPFTALPGTPRVNGLQSRAPGGGTLLTNNPNGANPIRYNPTNVNDLLTCDQDHNYSDEQLAFNGGKMNKFISTVGTGSGTSPTGQPCQARDVLNYYDGNTVTGLWNYAQHFAMSDNSYGTTFGPSSPGAINLASGDTGGVDPAKEIRGVTKDKPNADVVTGGDGTDTLTSDAQPYYDDCSNRDSVALTGQNIGNLLNARGLSWGWFEGGFTPSTPYSGPGSPAGTYDPLNVTGRAACATQHPIGAALGGTGQWGFKADYIPHHEPFEYYASTANPHHLAPASLQAVGRDTQTYTNGKPNFDTANHQYDTSTFDQIVSGIAARKLSPNLLPAVSFLKAAGYQDGHAAYSDPIDEQQFIVKEINALEKTPDWSSTAVVISYDDSDGWYDHAFSGITNPSQSVADALTGPEACGNTQGKPGPLAGQMGRCGFGPRLPLLVISPWARSNFVDRTRTNQASILRFIESNWDLGHIHGSFDARSRNLSHMFNFSGKHEKNKVLLLDPATGQPQA
jgi:phospholipase C